MRITEKKLDIENELRGSNFKEVTGAVKEGARFMIPQFIQVAKQVISQLSSMMKTMLKFMLKRGDI